MHRFFANNRTIHNGSKAKQRQKGGTAVVQQQQLNGVKAGKRIIRKRSKGEKAVDKGSQQLNGGNLSIRPSQRPPPNRRAPTTRAQRHAATSPATIGAHTADINKPKTVKRMVRKVRRTRPTTNRPEMMNRQQVARTPSAEQKHAERSIFQTDTLDGEILQMEAKFASESKRKRMVKKSVKDRHLTALENPASTSVAPSATPQAQSTATTSLQQKRQAARAAQKRLEDEIRQMEAAIALQSQRQPNVVHSNASRTTHPGAGPRHESEESYSAAASSHPKVLQPSTQSTTSQQERLEEEIRQMEAAIAAARGASSGVSKRQPSFRAANEGQKSLEQSLAALSPASKRKHQVATRFVRKAHQAPRTVATAPATTYTPAGDSAEAQQTAQAAILHRQRIEEEIRQLEAAIGHERKRKIKSVVKSQKSPSARDPAEAARLQLEHEIRQMEAAIAASQQKVSKSTQQKAKPVPQRNPASNLPPELAPYLQMQKIGLPEAAISHAMTKAGVSPQMQQLLLSDATTAPASHRSQRTSRPKPPPRASSAPTPATNHNKEPLTQQEQAIAAEYQKMSKMKLPQSAILHRMTKEGVSDKIIRAVFGARALSQKPRSHASTISPTTAPTTPTATTTSASSSSSSSSLLAGIQGAASARDARVQSGQTIRQDIAPEVKAQPRDKQLSFSFAEQVSKMARDREARLAAGGTKKMTVVLKEKEEYRHDFKSICIEAAELGRLTRLGEHVVEAVAVEKTREEEWRSSGLLAIQWRSNHMSVIHEAARLGNEVKMMEKVVSNCPEYEQDWDEDEEEINPRFKQLMELNRHAGAGQHKVDKLISGRKETQERVDLLVRPMYYYTNVEEVALPKATPPKFDPKKIQQRMAKRPKVDIGNEVATRAWERRARLDRPNSMPKITGVCACPYCENASPYQTYAYRVKEKKQQLEGHVAKHGR